MTVADMTAHHRDRPAHRVLVLHCEAWTCGTAEPREYEQIVSAVQEFCPLVEVVCLGLYAIGARGPSRYFGGESRLAAMIGQAVAKLGFGCQIGIADGLFAAQLAATHGPPPGWPSAAGPATGSASSAVPRRPAASGGPASGSRTRTPGRSSCAETVIVPAGATPAFLAGYPVAVLGDQLPGDLLPRLGIATLGEFAALPAAEVLNRFGTQGLAAHRLTRGLDPRPIIPAPAPADLSVHTEFEPAISQAEPAVFAAKSLAGQLHARLAASGLTCVRLQVQLLFENGQEITRLWRHDGLLSELAVAERVRWQLDGWQASARGAGRRASTGRDGAARPGEPQDSAARRGEPSDSAAWRGEPSDGPDPGDGVEAAGITILRLIPDQLVPGHGRQLGLWGDAVVSDRVARAALRVQALLGHRAVLQPVVAGGRSPAEQALLVPFGDAAVPDLPADRPWPGKIPAPAPATVFPVPRLASVTDDAGRPVTVAGRAEVSGSPARLSVSDSPALAVTAWAGPWPVAERWWDPPRARRKARFQLVTEDGKAWLAIVRRGRWQIEGRYD
jgi:protein ImuB